ncbi:DotA/TraY family protein [Stenotrophomonas sp. Marseille-Q4652]|uniref:DotA/TraY family protein n=1 Tax=Stenotrophomonas sp. Marseille-Q4652 TaxID=2866595 RepID=UPI001CE4A7C3|nr:DotA/TraY family protein [Stenotrophomonas sp. Marseille-Q4652]
MTESTRLARMPRPTLKERVEYRDTADAVSEFRETAEAIGRTPADCLREAARDWTAKTKAVYGLAPYLLLLVSLFLPGLAMAGPFDVPDSDLSKKLFLDNLFPELTGGGGGSPLGAAVGMFNTAVLIVAGILVMYTLIAGTLSTAHDGEMLGKKWSSLWLPIRTTLGAAAILPTMGGFSVIQAIVIWLALQGVGIANSVWGAYADNPLQGAAYVPPSEVRQLEKIAGQMFLQHVCRAGLEQAEANTDMSQLQGVGLRSWKATRQTTDNDNVMAWNYVTSWGFSCGTMMIHKPKRGDFATDASSAAARNLVDPYAIAQGVFPAHVSALTAMDARMSALADRFVAAPTMGAGDDTVNGPAVTAEIKAAAVAYSQTIKQASQSQANVLQSDDFKQALQQDGWVMAGAFYTKLAHALDSISSATSRSAQLSVQGEFPKALPDVQLRWAEASAALRDVTSPGAHTVGSEQGGNIMDKLLTVVLDSARDVDPEGMSGHPLIATKNTGESMKSWGIGIYTVGAVVVAAAGVIAGNVAGKGLGTDTALLALTDILSTPLFALVGPLILMGAVLSSVIPMLPFILWVGVVLGWIVLVTEAVIAAPLWAVAHMAPDGDGVVGRGGQGYMLVLSLTLRPALMVLGLICAIAILVPVGEWLNSTFAHVFRLNVMQDNPSWGGFINILMGLAIYSTLMVTVMTKIFSLIHVIPDNVLRWIGGGVDNMLGQNAQPLAGAVEGQSTNLLGAGVAAGAVTNQLGNKVAAAAREHAGRQRREEENNERQNSKLVEDLEQSREKAWEANDRAEERGSVSNYERAFDAEARHGQAALNVAGRMDAGFGQRLAQARQADAGTGGTQAQDELIASEASTAPDAKPYQQALAEAQRAFAKAERNAQAAKKAAEPEDE